MESAMNGGDGSNSYSKNSEWQRIAANTVNEKIDEEIQKNLDVKTLSSVSNTIRLADLGCSTGPNTFVAMRDMLEAIKRKHVSQNPNSQFPEFQVFFNDQISNDFNTLFNSLPANRQYFAAGVPGSFHGRLFPESSLHLVYSCYSVQWLSKIPQETLEKDSPAWNKSRIYYLNAPREVYNAYRSQFSDDVDSFLSARAKEIVGGGMMVLIMLGHPNEVDSQSCDSTITKIFDFMGSTFMEMANEGLISEDLVDTFNMPVYPTNPAELCSLVERNNYFNVKKIEYSKPVITDTMRSKNERDPIKFLRVVYDGILSTHFGSEFTNEMFERMNTKFRVKDNYIALTSGVSGMLFVVLQRK